MFFMVKSWRIWTWKSILMLIITLMSENQAFNSVIICVYLCPRTHGITLQNETWMNSCQGQKATSAFTPYELMHVAYSSCKVSLRSTKTSTIFLRKLHYVNVAWQQNTRHTLDTETISDQHWWNTTWRPQLDERSLWAAATPEHQRWGQ